MSLYFQKKTTTNNKHHIHIHTHTHTWTDTHTHTQIHACVHCLTHTHTHTHEKNINMLLCAKGLIDLNLSVHKKITHITHSVVQANMISVTSKGNKTRIINKLLPAPTIQSSYSQLSHLVKKVQSFASLAKENPMKLHQSCASWLIKKKKSFQSINKKPKKNLTICSLFQMSKLSLKIKIADTTTWHIW